MSRFIDGIADAAAKSSLGLHFGAADALGFARWSEIHQTAVKIAGRLTADGVTPGSRVGVLAANAEDVAPVCQGIWMAGAAMTMLQQPSPQADLNQWHAGTLRSLEMLSARFVVVGQPFLAVAEDLRSSGYHVIEIPDGWPDAAVVMRPTAEDDVALYQLTSGSTGDPKAVAITHRNLYANAVAMKKGAAADPDTDVMMSWLPLSHDMGLVGFLLTPMYYGVKTVYVPPTEFLKSPLNWIQLLSEHRATMTAAPNFAYSIIHRRLKAVDDGAYDLSALRFVLCGAEPIDPATMHEFARQTSRFGMREEAVVAAYGLAEATLAVSFSQVDRPLTVERLRTREFETARRAITTTGCADASLKDVVLLGPPLAGTEVRVLGVDGVTLPARHVGEIAIRGDAVTRHYATSEGEVAAIDDHGWLHTGDLGYLTHTGEVAVCGRLKNVIIVAGRNIFPCDLERLAESADGIRRGAVVAFGVSRPDQREEIRIVAETMEKYPDDVSQAIRRQVARSVFNATGLSPSVMLVDKGVIPKTPSGKIRHVAAKETFEKAS
ncbi:MAG: fatty acyl-AMP ligase [Mycobacterium sp.]|uniref:fatty acyl-AMP ligase n=1 Tax=Mycobacterium sp. TaxID=1785 RepID=UPI003CC55350